MKKIESLKDIKPHQKNHNRGTERGRKMLEDSISRLGAGRSIVVDKNGTIVAGNHTAQVAAEIGLHDLVVVRTDGRKLVVVQREDWDLDKDAQAREYAYADNRVGEVNLDYEPLRIADDLAEGVDLSHLWTPQELAKLLKDVDAPDLEGGGGGGKADGLKYSLEFQSPGQQDRWYIFLGYLKRKYEGETVAERLDAFLQAFDGLKEGA